MGSLTLIQICNAALVRNLFGSEQAIINNTDPDVAILAEIANQVVAEFQNEDWGQLVRTGVVDVSSPDVTDGLQWTITGDAHHLVGDTAFSTSGVREVLLPVSAGEWAERSVRTSSGTLQYAFRLFGRQLTAVDRAPANDCRYEYVSNRLILKNTSSSVAVVDQVAGDFRQRFANDADVPNFDDELMIQSIAWRHARVKRLEGWQEQYTEATGYKRKLLGQSSLARTVRLGQNRSQGYSAPIAEQELSY